MSVSKLRPRPGGNLKQVLFVAVTLLLLSRSVNSFSMTPPPRIAVIGAGASGIVTARVLLRNGITPKVFEKQNKVGGVWNYIPKPPINASPDHHQNQNHSPNLTNAEPNLPSPMYRGLRTNLPKELMAYREFPWTDEFTKDSYVTHRNVAEYLNTYQRHFDLEKYICFGSTIQQLTILDEASALSPENEVWPKVQLSIESKEDDGTPQHEVFDAVFVCNGHYARPSSPAIPGLQHFKGATMHSIEYDDPSIFADMTVLCIGGRASGSDLAREISKHAKHVYLSDSTCHSSEGGQPKILGNVTWVPRTLEVQEDGSVRFGDNCVVQPTVDQIIFCSGYDYSFPFINERSNLDLQCVPGERCVKPLYRQLWHARYPNVAFVGLPQSVVPFPFFELQAEATCAVWLKLSQLPPLRERLEAAKRDVENGGTRMKGRVQETHHLGSAQWDYNREMAKIAGNYDDEMETYISTNKLLFDHSGTSRKSLFPGGPDSYRSVRYTRDTLKDRIVVAQENENSVV